MSGQERNLGLQHKANPSLLHSLLKTKHSVRLHKEWGGEQCRQFFFLHKSMVKPNLEDGESRYFPKRTERNQKMTLVMQCLSEGEGWR